jgi:hypothetical protein
VLSVIQLLGQQNASPSEAPEGGITIVQRGGVPKLIAQGKILDSVTGFSTTLHFPSPELQHASALHAVGIPMGTPSKDSPFAGMGYFTPHVVLRNLTAKSQTVTLTAEYPSAPGWDSTEDRISHPTPGTKSSEDSPPPAPPDPSKFTGQTALAPIVLPGYSTEDVALDSILGELTEPTPYASIRIQYSGAPDSVVTEVSSVEQNKDLVVDSKLQNEGNGWAGSGANPWHLDDETESIVLLTDMADKPARIGFDVWAEGTHYYLTNLKLNPHETRAINLRSLRDRQQRDFRGSKIPAGATDGTVMWIRLDNVRVMGRVAVISHHGGVASSYDCCICQCPANDVSLTVTPGSAVLFPQQTSQLTATDAKVNCNGVYSYSNWTNSVSWSSDTASVATVNSTGMVTAVGTSSTYSTNITAGTVGYTYSWNPVQRDCESSGFSLQGSATVTVPVPTSLKVLSTSVLATGTTGNYGCLPSANDGIMIDVDYQVLDQETPAQPVQSSNMIPHETGRFMTGGTYSNNIGPTHISDTSEYTAANGTFHDAPVGTCGNFTFSGTITQNIQILIGSASYSVRSQSYTVSSSGVGHGKITNGSDVSASR